MKDKQYSEFSDKYTKAGTVGQYLIKEFYKAVSSLINKIPSKIENVLEVGAGQGYSTEKLALMLPKKSNFQASEFESKQVDIFKTRLPSFTVTQESVYDMQRENNSLDLIFMLEVLEHLDNPQLAIDELHRTCSGYLILSTPREPIWRITNMLRFKYLSYFGNTPGHIQHWSTDGLINELSTKFILVSKATPFPWTILLLKPKK